jgi:predicted Zn-dependent protease
MRILGSRTRGPLLAVVLAVTAVSFVLFSCATNPVSGKRELALVSEGQEIELGKQADRDVIASVGLYPDERWQRYVQGLGTAIAAHSERPNLPWTFRVVDDPAVNAFAIPGGFVYVTRGILAHLNSEAELVAVLGHEIGHVTARHSVSQMSKAQLAQLGLGVALILSPDARPYGDLAAQGLGLLFLKFGRADESEADRLGLGYMLERGYDPREMEHVFETLDRVSRSAGSGRLPQWASSHPDPENRRSWARGAATAALTGKDPASLNVQRAAYVKRLDGLAFGEDPREGFFDGPDAAVFHHPELAFRLEFPRGWKTSNQKTAVGAVSPAQDAKLVLQVAEGSARAAAERFFAQAGVTADTPWKREIHGFPTVSYTFRATTEQGEVRGLVAWIESSGRVYQFLGFTSAARWSARADEIFASVSSFERERDAKVLAVEPKRLKIEELDRARTLGEFSRQYPSAVSLETLALINNLQATSAIPAGAEVKRVVD